MSAGWWALLLASLLLFLALGDAPERTLFWDAFFDAGHLPLFGLVALAILGLLRAGSAPADHPRTWWLAFVLTVTLGALTEILQVFQPNRDVSIEDFLRDVAGAGAFLLMAAAVGFRKPACGPVRTAAGRATAAVVSGLLLVAASAHLATTVALYVERSQAFPTLFALDGSWWERRLIDANASVLTPRTRPLHQEMPFDEPLARLDLKPGTFPGLAFNEPYPDWSRSRSLAFTIVSDLEAALPLTIRVHDAAHDQRTEDRFNRSLVINPGVNRVVIPLDEVRHAPDRREMDMRRIRGIILFGYRLTKPTHVYVSAIRLVD
ncbi:MAG TPA: VanZ family protein [Vicinamibacterales bacterium]